MILISGSVLTAFSMTLPSGEVSAPPCGLGRRPPKRYPLWICWFIMAPCQPQRPDPSTPTDHIIRLITGRRVLRLANYAPGRAHCTALGDGLLECRIVEYLLLSG